MATTYNKDKFDKLKQRVVEKVYEYGVENDSCDSEMINFVSDALSVASTTAERMLNEAKKQHAKSYTLTIKFTVPHGEELVAVDDDYVPELIINGVNTTGKSADVDVYMIELGDWSINLEES